MRVVQAIVKHFHTVLIVPCEIFLSMYAKLLESETVPLWYAVLILEYYRSFFTDEITARSIYSYYDSNEDAANVYSEMVVTITKVIYQERKYLQAGDESNSLGAAGSSVKVSLYSQIDIVSSSLTRLSLLLRRSHTHYSLLFNLFQMLLKASLHSYFNSLTLTKRRTHFFQERGQKRLEERRTSFCQSRWSRRQVRAIYHRLPYYPYLL